MGGGKGGGDGGMDGGRVNMMHLALYVLINDRETEGGKGEDRKKVYVCFLSKPGGVIVKGGGEKGGFCAVFEVGHV